MPDAGWLPLEIATYLIARPDSLSSELAIINRPELVRWIEETELSWLPCSPILAEGCEQYVELYQRRTSDWDFVVSLFGDSARATFEVADNKITPISSEALLASRRRLPQSTIIGFSGISGEFLTVTTSHAISQMLELGCVDPHVHQGAAIGFDLIVRAAVFSLTDIGELSHSLGGSLSLTLDVGSSYEEDILAIPLLAGLSIAASRSNEEDLSSVGADVLRACRQDKDAWARLRDAVSESGPLDQSAWPVTGVAYKRSMDMSWSRSAILLFLKCESLLYRGLSQQATGLDQFVAAFNRFALVRKIPKISRSDYVSMLANESRKKTTGLRHIDLRLGERVFGATEGLSETELQGIYLDFYTAYGKYLESAGQAVTMTFPMGFIKSSADQSNNWHWDTTGLWRTAAAFIAVMGDCASTWELADGIDVCGSECEIPNWLIVPALSQISLAAHRAGHQVSYRFHAGEWHWTPLHGIRRIEEALNVDTRGFRHVRIGHGLALKDDDWSRLPEQPIDELLDDLVFAYGQIAYGAGPHLAWRLERVIRYIAKICYGRQTTDWLASRNISIMLAAYRSRFEVDVLQRISNLAQIGADLYFQDAKPSPARKSGDALVAAHMGVGCRRDPLSAIVRTSSELASLRYLVMDCYELVLPAIFERLRHDEPLAVIEVCPTSNVSIGTFRGIRRHPVTAMVDNGLKVVVGTDDPSIFHSWLAEEYDLLNEGSGISLDSLEIGRKTAEALHSRRNPDVDRKLVEHAIRHCGG